MDCSEVNVETSRDCLLFATSLWMELLCIRKKAIRPVMERVMNDKSLPTRRKKGPSICFGTKLRHLEIT